MEKRSILWVDDDVDDLELMREVLKSSDFDFHVSEATNGKEAINFLRKAQYKNLLPCLVILDLNMPVMNGREALKVMKEDPQLKEIPVIVFTTSHSEMDKLYCRRFGVEMVTKPFTFDNLKQVIDRLLSYCGVNRA